MLFRIKRYFNLSSFAETLSDNDLVSRQRLRLFKITSLFSFIVFLAFILQTAIVLSQHFVVLGLISSLFIFLFINYFSLNNHKKQHLAYLVLVMILFTLLHIITYFQGGVRNSGMFYLAGLILTAYMLLGNQGGKLMAVISIMHIAYFYWVNRNTNWVTYDLVGAEAELIDLDFLLTGIIAILVLTSQSDYIEKTKNAIIKDILDKKDELNRKNIELKKLSLVASKTNNGVIITDNTGRVEWVNDGFTRLMGFSYDEIIGKKTSTLLHGEDTNMQTVFRINQQLAVGKSCDEELLKYKKDGSSIWINENITPIMNHSGEVEKYIFIESDISERKDAEIKMEEYLRDLEKTNRELDKFAYVVSHDLKAPLRAIGNLTGWIEEDMGTELSESVRSNFGIIKGRVVRMEALINGILEYSKASKKTESLETFDSKQVVRDSFDLIGAPSNCEFTISRNLPIMYSEKTKLQQIFLNLINNAIKYNDKSKMEILVDASEEKAHWHFSITDNGPGIEKQFHEKIFVIFQTLNARDEVESTGVGLAIVKKIIEEQGGRIWVESEKGKGATFHFTWPKSNARNAEDISKSEFMPV